MPVNVSDKVESEITRVFGPKSAHLISKIKTSDFSLGAMSADRIILAILFGSKGELKRFEELVELSTRDWRDTLMAAGLANADWREVLRNNGYWVPEEE